MTLGVHAIACQRGGMIVFSDVSLTLPDSQTIVITGPNGSGKSTLLRACAGLNDPVAGILDHVPSHWIGPHAPLKPTLTVHDNLAFWLALQGGTYNEATILRALHHFEIAHLSKHPLNTLSSGQVQRVSLARLFLTNEKLWLLDEPESRLDTEGREMMLSVIHQHSGDGGMAMIATHHAEMWNASLFLPLPSGEGPILTPLPPGEGRVRGKQTDASHEHPLTPTLSRGERGLLPVFTATLCRDLSLLHTNKADALQPVILFILLIILFPLTLGPDTTTLAPLSGGLIMMATLFASLLSLANIFADDAADGTIETIMTTAAPMPIYTAARIFAHWLANGLPITILSPVALVLLGASTQPLPILLTIGAATFLFTLIGSAISALVLSAYKGAILLALLAAPLYIPILIFGSGAIGQSVEGVSPTTPLMLLWAMVALFLPLAPFMAAGCLRLMKD